MFNRLIIFIAASVSYVFTSCGGPGEKPPENKRVEVEQPIVTQQEPITVRASTTWDIKSEDGVAWLVPASGTTVINSVISASVEFTLSGTNFISPLVPGTGVTSYGYLRLTHLRDNDLEVCGLGGDEQCTTAAIRIYTTGPGPGFYNSEKAATLPITTTSSVNVGFGPENATQLASVDVSADDVLNLVEMTGGPTFLKIPISINFTEAPAGSYTTTLVVEYVLQ